MSDVSKEFDVERYYQLSNDRVYGDLPLDRENLFFTESIPLNLSSPKASADF